MTGAFDTDAPSSKRVIAGANALIVVAFAVGCALSSSYGFLAGTWPFGIVEGIWSLMALKRYLDQRAGRGEAEPRSAEASTPSATSRPGSSAMIESRRSELS